jgi:hypothetical protein
MAGAPKASRKIAESNGVDGMALLSVSPKATKTIAVYP